MGARKVKDARLSLYIKRVPTVEECAACQFKNDCEGGRYCTPKRQDADKPKKI